MAIYVDHTMTVRCDTVEELNWAEAKLEIQRLAVGGNPRLISHVVDTNAKTIEVVFEEELIDTI